MTTHDPTRIVLIHAADTPDKALAARIADAGYEVVPARFGDGRNLNVEGAAVIVLQAEGRLSDCVSRVASIAGPEGPEIIAVADTDDPEAGLALLSAGASCWVPQADEGGLLELLIDRAARRHRSLCELPALHRRFRQLVDNAPVGVFEMEKGVLTYINHFIEELSGYTRSELIGRPAADLVAKEDQKRLHDALVRKVQGDEVPTIYHFIGKSGATYVGEVRSRPIGDPGEGKLEGTIRDITQETRLMRLHNAILNLAEIILGERDIDRILQLVLDTITEYSGFRRAVLSLYDLSIPVPFEGDVYKILSSGLDPEQDAALRSQDPMSIEQRRGVFQDEFRLGPAYYVPHTKTPWAPEWGLKGTISVEGWHVDDFLFIPLRGTSGIIGSISVDDPIDQSVPRIDSIEPVAALANFAALAVERVHKLDQLRRQKDRLHALWGFGTELSEAGSIEMLCDLAARRTRDDMDYDYCAIWIAEGPELVKLGMSTKPLFPPGEMSAKGLRSPIEGPGITRWALKYDEPVIIPDAREDERYNGSRASIRSVIAIPIPGRKGPSGAICAESQRLAAFGEDDLEVLSALASQLSVAVSDQRRREALERIYSFGQRIASASTVEQVVSNTLDFLADQFPDEIGEFFLFDDRGRLALADLRGPYARGSLERGWILPPGTGVIGWVARNRRGALIEEVSSDPRYHESFPETRSELAVPVLVTDRLYGVLNLESLVVGFFDNEDRQLLEVVANHLATALSNLASQASLRDQAVRDPLTGLYNRHYFNSLIAPELSRSDRYEHPLTLMMLDVNGFRAINNRFGHLKGDEVLKEVAICIRENVRSADRVIRYGGDEFLVFMPETDREAPPVAARLRAKVEAVPRRAGIAGVEIGLAIGLYTRLPHESRSLESILEEVDRRMYADKRRQNVDRADEYRS